MAFCHHIPNPTISLRQSTFSFPHHPIFDCLQQPVCYCSYSFSPNDYWIHISSSLSLPFSVCVYFSSHLVDFWIIVTTYKLSPCDRESGWIDPVDLNGVEFTVIPTRSSSSGWRNHIILTLFFFLPMTGKLMELTCSMLGAFGQDSHFSSCQWKIKLSNLHPKQEK